MATPSKASTKKRTHEEFEKTNDDSIRPMDAQKHDQLINDNKLDNPQQKKPTQNKKKKKNLEFL